ncbi:hypothetical protein CIB48_g6624 [Xylaria polymorpha]|nr:hypothetical protein CIB48_g6624 [Xylaria polymorpha]
MCQDIQQVTFFCGHQTKFWWGKSRFCLFTGDRATRFHTTYLQFDRNEENCARCQVTQRTGGKKWESLSQKARSELTAEKIAELELQIKETVAYYLYKDNCTPNSRVILLRTLTSLPDIFNVQELVRFFASRYFGEDNKERKLLDWERKKLFSVAHHARLDRTFKAGLNLEPLPLPPSHVEAVQKRIEEAHAKKAAPAESKAT